MHVKHTIASFLLTSGKCTKESRDQICLDLLRGELETKVDREGKEDNQEVGSSSRMLLSDCNPHSIYTREKTVIIHKSSNLSFTKTVFVIKKKKKGKPPCQNTLFF